MPERCPQCGGGIAPDWQPAYEGDLDGATWRNVGATRETSTDRPCRHPWHDEVVERLASTTSPSPRQPK